MQQLTHTSAAERVLGRLDLIDNIAATLQSNNAIGLAAAIKVVPQVVIFLAALVFWWYLDLDSTWTYSTPLSDLIGPTIPYFGIGSGIAFALRLVLTLLPSAIQAEYYKLTLANVVMSKPIYWGSIGFDAVTDAPRVTAICNIFASDPHGWALVGYLIAWSVLLAIATVGLQHIVAMSFANVVYSLGNINRSA